eukprot:TRINITY_DN20749_c0_g1_i1.p1 TRINITY_DN20749_c0_g1~~TRINITY_DN20749_c0_g1_i1.p1  ORF type:complete len:290 (+),score=99.06 TRINITY_DN20749_c0_g1_i1:58-927(+)
MSATQMTLLKNPTGVAGRYEGKVVLVTGGTNGIGEGCVRVFLEAGADVAFCAREVDIGTAAAKKLNGLLQGMGRRNRAFFVRADCSVHEDVAGMVDAVVAEFGRLDCLVNNAGWHPPNKFIDDFSVEDLHKLMNLNFYAYFLGCQRALPHLRKTKGNIINMSSFVGYAGQIQGSTYAATKGATTSFTKALAIDEARHQVRVNCVSPGNVWTALWAEIAENLGGADKVLAPGSPYLAVQTMQRMGTIEEAGRLCLAIAADLTFTTGVDHLFTGGAELGYGARITHDQAKM